MHYISSDGYDIYVGKNNIQNDELTFSLQMAVTGGFTQKVLPDPTSLSKQMAMNFRTVLLKKPDGWLLIILRTAAVIKSRLTTLKRNMLRNQTEQNPGSWFIIQTTLSLLTLTSAT